MRLFVAIELDDTARDAIHQAQRRIATALGPDARMLRFVRAEHLHVTLLFLGEVAQARMPSLLEALRPPLALAPFTLTFGGVGVFPSRGAPRALWLGLSTGAAAVTALRGLVAARVGVPAAGHEGGPSFTPHVTLGRWRRSGLRHRLALPRVEEATASVGVASVTLFESRLSTSGPAYTALLRTELTCR